MPTKTMKPDFLFEVSWEVCNKVGGIHTVIATKSTSIKNDYNDNYIVIGPELVQVEEEPQEFEPDNNLFAAWREQAAKEGLRVKVGRWKIPSSPIAILIDFSNFMSQKDEIFGQLWQDFKLDSLSGQWDYVEPALFGYAAGKTIESFIRYNLTKKEKIVAQFHEWMTGTGVLHLKKSHSPGSYSFYNACYGSRSLPGRK
jgi:phosphorylase/glycogen(starch) synthase